MCPPNIPLLRFADIEVHNNGRFGMRISSEESGMISDENADFFAPKRNPCQKVSVDNPYQTSEFLRIYAWRNRHDGVFVGSIAGVHMVDWVLADNTWRSIEFNGVSGGSGDLVNGIGGFDGGWGAVALIRPIIIGHDLPCPNCDRDPALIYWGTDGDGDGGSGGGGNWGGFDLWGNIMMHGGWDSPVQDTKLGYFRKAMALEHMHAHGRRPRKPVSHSCLPLCHRCRSKHCWHAMEEVAKQAGVRHGAQTRRSQLGAGIRPSGIWPVPS